MQCCAFCGGMQASAMVASMSRNLVLRAMATLVLALLAVLSVSGVLDRKGDAWLQQGLTRALVTFAVSRGLNGIISVAQETEVSLEPAGVGVTLMPGQILDPVNDLIERFSWVMLASSTSLGLQKLFASIASWPFFSWGLALWIALAIVLLWWPVRGGWLARWRKPVLKATAIFLLLRFLAPMVAFAGEVVYDVFLQERYEQSLQGLRTAQQEVAQIQSATAPQPAPTDGGSFLDKARSLYQSARDTVNIRDRMQQLADIASRTTENAIELIVIFLFQTIIFPLLFLWVLIRVSRRILGG